MKIGAGELDKRIIIQRDDTVRDAIGGTTKWTTPTDFATISAKMIVATTPAREASGEQKFPVSTQRVDWKVRHRDDLLPDMRIKWVRGAVVRYFEIRAIRAASAREQFMIIETEEVR